MTNCLVLTNICLGSLTSSCSLYCHNANVVLENILKTSSEYDQIIICNDSHTPQDNEFKYLPPHMIQGTSECYLLRDFIHKLKPKLPILTLRKRTLSVIGNEHNKQLLMGTYHHIHLGGFSGVDCISSSLDLIDLGENIKVRQELMGDLSPEIYNRNLEFLRFMNLI